MSDSARGRSRLRVRLVAAVLIVLCAGMLGYEVRRGAFEAARDGLRSDGRVLVYNRVEEIRRQFADRVPAGSRIHIVAPSEFGTFWHLRLSEFATFHRVLVTEPTEPAELAVAVHEDGGGRYGVRLFVERML